MTKHSGTPGPWLSKRINTQFGVHNYIQCAETRGWIARMEDTHPDLEANARLIAAAPELLEAAKTAIKSLELAEYRMRVNDWAEGSDIESDDPDATRAYHAALDGMQEALQLTRAAVAKAVGSKRS